LDRWILAIADDLTGALEIGAKFALHGITARVTTELCVCAPPAVPVIVIDSEARHLTAGDAEKVVRDIAFSASRFSPWLIYKKTDSTLRGNIAAEFRALLDVFADRSLIYAPAYPEMGRTVKDGRLFLWGTPVHESVFAFDLLNPIRESDIRVLLEDVPAVVLDGESNADIQAAACMVMASEKPLAAGPSALAEALAKYLHPPEATSPQWPSIAHCLVVNGSLHPASLNQIAFARERGFFDEKWRYFDSEAFGSGLERAGQNGLLVRNLLNDTAVDAIVVFGGDTVFGIHRALDAPTFQSYGEVIPGVPLSSCGGLFWITKAGGFGDEDILYNIRRHLT
jgi:uncharacterized protein YgbK (DUF1537 family)